MILDELFRADYVGAARHRVVHAGEKIGRERAVRVDDEIRIVFFPGGENRFQRTVERVALAGLLRHHMNMGADVFRHFNGRIIRFLDDDMNVKKIGIIILLADGAEEVSDGEAFVACRNEQGEPAFFVVCESFLRAERAEPSDDSRKIQHDKADGDPK